MITVVVWVALQPLSLRAASSESTTHGQVYRDAEIIGISVDSFLVLDKFKKENGYNFTFLSDFNKEACRAYGAFYENFVLDMKGVAKRSAFVVDKKGIVRYAEVLEDAREVPNFAAIRGVLQEI